MNKGAALRLSAGFDREMIWYRGGSVRHLVVEATAPEAAADPGEATALHLAVVLDCLDWMMGPRLDAARQAAEEILADLDARDRLSLISLAAGGTVPLAARMMDAEGKAEALRVLEELTPARRADLATGWLKAVQQVTGVPAGEGRPHVLLLSAGEAPRRALDPSGLAQRALELRQRGVCTSTVGIGPAYSSLLLTALAAYGGGRMHAAEDPPEIGEVTRAELDALRGLIAQETWVEIQHPEGVEVDQLTDFPAQTRRDRVHSLLGPLRWGESRRFIAQYRLPMGREGETLEFSARLRRGSDPTGGSDPVRAQLCFAKRRRAAAPACDARRGGLVALIWLARLERQAVRLNRSGAYSQAEDLLRDQARHFEGYCQPLEEGAALLQRFEQMQRHIGRPLSEGARKRIELRAHQVLYGQEEVRARRRDEPDRGWEEGEG